VLTNHNRILTSVIKLWKKKWRNAGSDERRRRENRGAEREENVEGVSPPQPTRGSGEALWAPPAGSGAEPQPKTNLVHFVAARRTLIAICLISVSLNTAVVSPLTIRFECCNKGDGVGCPTPQPTRGPGGASWAPPARPKTNLVHFVAARRTLTATICLICVSLNTAVA